MTTTSLHSLTALALERSQQPATATCPSSLQGCLLFAALRQTEKRIAANHLAVRELATAAGQSSQDETPDSNHPPVLSTESPASDSAQDLR